MKHMIPSILVALLVVGLLLSACNDSRGVHANGGVQGPDGVVGSRPDPKPLGETQPDDVIVIENSGKLVTREYAYTGFSELEIGSLDVDIQQGDTFRVVAKVEENLFDYLRVTQQGDALSVGLDPNEAYHMISITKRVEITMPTLTKLVVTGASEVTMRDLNSPDALAIIVDGPGSLLASSCSARALSIIATVASSVDLTDLTVGDVDVEADGSSKVIVSPSGQLDVVARGTSTVFYLGNPTLGKIDTDFPSSVEQK
jgi:hypothetical protein